MFHPSITPTHLTIERYRQKAAIPPQVFYAFTLLNCGIDTPYANCGNGAFWSLSPDQNEYASLQELAEAIKRAEHTIANYLGYTVGDEFKTCRRAEYPKTPCGNMRQKNSHNWKTVSVKGHEVKRYGSRAVDYVGTFDVTYIDEDNSGFEETAIIEVSPIEEQYICQLRMMFVGGNGSNKYEIAPIDNYEYDATTQTLTIESCTWFFQDPANKRQKSKLGGCFEACEMCCPNPVEDCESPQCVVPQVEIWREYIDENRAATLVYNGKANKCGNCNACQQDKFPACLQETGCNTARVIPTCAQCTDVISTIENVTVSLSSNTLTTDATTAQTVYNALADGLFVKIFDTVSCKTKWLFGGDICKLKEFADGDTTVTASQYQSTAQMCHGDTEQSLNSSTSYDNATITIYDWCYNVASGCACIGEPDFVDINYLTGCDSQCPECDECDGLTRICPELEQAVFALASAYLPRNACNCGCKDADVISRYSKSAVVRSDFGAYVENFNSADKKMEGFFVANYLCGEIEAWNIVKTMRRSCC